MKKCKVEGCNRDHAAKGYCKAHHGQWKRFGYTKEIRERVMGYIGCRVYKCEGIHFAKNFCRRHYNQYCRSGTVRSRFTTDPNEFIEKKDCYEIVLYHADVTERKERGIIDKDDYKKCKDIKWCLSGKRCQYIWNGKIGHLHHHVWGKKVQLDHINRNKLDCRKSNLREATYQQNAHNRGMMSNNTSGITGVRWSKRLQKWRAQIYLNGKNRHLGLFTNIDDAKDAYDNAVLKYREQFGRTN